MAVEKMAKARARSSLLGCVVQLVAFPFVLAFVLGLVAVASATPPEHAWVLFTALGVGLPVVLFGGIAALFAVLIRSRANAMDPAFAFLGAGHQTSVVGRGWAGTFSGREANAWFNKGPQLELYLSADTRARAAAGQDNALARAAIGVTGRERVALGSIAVTGPDAEWVRRWVEVPGVREALEVLLEEDGASLRSVSVQPDCVHLTLRYQYGWEESTVRGWFSALDVCAAAAESVGPPDPPETPGLASRFRTRRGSLGSFLAITLGITAALLLFAALLSIVMVVLIQP